MNRRTMICGMLCGALVACVPAYVLVDPGVVSVGDLSLRVPGPWNRAPSVHGSSLHGNAEVWTRDGVLLDRLLVIPAVADGESLIHDRRESAALPEFRVGMLPNELEELLESTMVKYFGEGRSAVSTTNLRPQRFGEQRGIMFDLHAAVNDSPDYDGLAGAFVAGGKLYVVVYLAAQPYYYDKHLADAEAVIRSAHLRRSG